MTRLPGARPDPASRRVLVTAGTHTLLPAGSAPAPGPARPGSVPTGALRGAGGGGRPERPAAGAGRIPARLGGPDRPVAISPRGSYPAGLQRAAFPAGQPAPDAMNDPVGDGVVQAWF